MSDTNAPEIWQLEDWPRFTWQRKIMPPILRELHRLEGQLQGFSSIFPNHDLKRIVFESQVQNVMYRFNPNTDNSFRIEVEAAVAQCTGYKSPQVNRRFPVTNRVMNQAQIVLNSVSDPSENFNKFKIIQWYKWLKDSETAQKSELSPELRTIELPKTGLPKERLNQELNIFIQWFNQTRTSVAIDPIIRASISFMWLSLIKPFEGFPVYVAFSMSEQALAQGDLNLNPLINLLAALENEEEESKPHANLQEAYTATLNSNLDITPWILWFLGSYKRALLKGIANLEWHYRREKFWLTHHTSKLNKDQLSVLDIMLSSKSEDYRWGISASQYMHIAKVSKATATRHLTALVSKGCLKRRAAGGRSTRYELLF